MSEQDLIEKSWNSVVQKDETEPKKKKKVDRLFVAVLWKTTKKTPATFCGLFASIEKAKQRALQHAEQRWGLRAIDETNEKEVLVLCKDGTEYFAELRAVD